MDKEPLIFTSDEDLASVASKLTRYNKETAIIMEDGKVNGILKFTDLCFAIKTFIFGKFFMDKIPLYIKLAQINEFM